MSVKRWLCGTLGVLLVTVTLATGVGGAADPTPAPSARPSARPTVAPSPSPEPSASTSPAQSYVRFVRGAEKLPGVIDLIRKDDDLYFDLGPDNFGKPYIIMPAIASGVGGEAFAGRSYDPLVVIFKRVGRRVLWITPNTRFVAEKDSAAAASLAVSVADTVIASTSVVAEDPEKTHVVIAPALFLTDFEGIGADLGRGVPPTTIPGLLSLAIRATFSVDATKSYYVRTKAFERNDEILVNLTFNGPPRAFSTVPDGRGIPILIHYSIIAPPGNDPGYVPREADDRVGYFIAAHKRYGDDELASPFERYIERWNLAAGPIVFTLTKQIPPQYHDTVRNAILAWNDAFAQAGHPDAIEVRDQPDDPAFDPEDARYNSVLWVTSDAPSFSGVTSLVADPDSGQLIRAQIVLDGEAMRAVRRGYTDRALPVNRVRESGVFGVFGAPAPDADRDGACDVQDEGAAFAALGMARVMRAHPSAADRERYAHDYLTWVVMHETGHTLGLRHNFAGSTAYSPAQLHDPAFTRTHGISGSVMDYVPPNVAAPNERQADYFATRLGAYDIWAIAYGYTATGAPAPAAERVALSWIAAASTLPGHAYGTDEEAGAPFALDPRISRYDLSSDPLGHDQSELAIDDDLARHLTDTYRGDTRSYQDMRATFVNVLNNQLAATTLAARYLGGIYTSRAHRDQAGAPPPFAAIPRAEQRRAFALLDRYVFSTRAFRYPPELLNTVVPVRFGSHWDSGALPRPDFPLREVAAEIQDAAIAQMFAPATLARIANQELKTRPGETMSLGDLYGWTNAAIFDDLGQPAIAPLHRDLQRRFTDLQIAIALLASAQLDQLSLPRDVQSLARFQLQKLAHRLVAARGAATEVATRAHLDDLASRVGGALAAHTNRAL